MLNGMHARMYEWIDGWMTCDHESSFFDRSEEYILCEDVVSVRLTRLIVAAIDGVRVQQWWWLAVATE